MSLESLTRLVNQGNAVEPICLKFKGEKKLVGGIKYVHILNSRIWEDVNLHSKRDFSGVILVDNFAIGTLPCIVLIYPFKSLKQRTFPGSGEWKRVKLQELCDCGCRQRCWL